MVDREHEASSKSACSVSLKRTSSHGRPTIQFVFLVQLGPPVASYRARRATWLSISKMVGLGLGGHVGAPLGNGVGMMGMSVGYSDRVTDGAWGGARRSPQGAGLEGAGGNEWRVSGSEVEEACVCVCLHLTFKKNHFWK